MIIRQLRAISPLPAVDDSTGRWLWALEDSRTRTKALVADLTVRQLDTVAPGLTNSIGTLLYHIALIEADYLSVDVLGLEDTLIDPLLPLFPFDARDNRERLSVMSGIPASDHIARLDAVRTEVINTYSEMTLAELDARRELPEWGFVVTPGWVLHHLMQHEAEHRGEIRSLISLVG